ncbi:MAG TPA: response regulator transcription factor [Polyangiaceae bacterium]|nr:response regulator transcription factor [Polyangiaceae bacterium]
MLGLLFAAAVVADSPVMRRGLADILGTSPELEVVGSAALDEARALDVGTLDVIVEDVPDDAAVETALGRVPPGVPVLALVGRPERARELVQGGVQGALRRDASSDSLTAASVAVAAGLYAFDRDTFAPFLAPPAAPVDAGTLTAREREVLELVASGLSNRAIGQALGVSEHTVKFHVRSLLDKLGAETRADAVARAARRGLLTL